MKYSIYAESTPNPEVMKFVSNRMLSSKNIEIKNTKEAKGISIAEELLKFPFVKSIYLSSNFISISKKEAINWEDIAMPLRTFISEHLNNHEIQDYAKNISNKEKLKEIKNEQKKFNEDEQEIEKILKEYIAPAVESDGGSITLKYYKNNIVCVNLQGACSGCPASTSTLKGGIENLLKQKINPNIEVISNEE